MKLIPLIFFLVLGANCMAEPNAEISAEYNDGSFIVVEPTLEDEAAATVISEIHFDDGPVAYQAPPASIAVETIVMSRKEAVTILIDSLNRPTDFVIRTRRVHEE